MLFVLLTVLPLLMAQQISQIRYIPCVATTDQQREFFDPFWEGKTERKVTWSGFLAIKAHHAFYGRKIPSNILNLNVTKDFMGPYGKEEVAEEEKETVKLFDEHVDKVKNILDRTEKYGCYCVYSKQEKMMGMMCIWQ